MHVYFILENLLSNSFSMSGWTECRWRRKERVRRSEDTRDTWQEGSCSRDGVTHVPRVVMVLARAAAKQALSSSESVN